MQAPFSDPNLQYLSITDFSPGIVRFGRGLSTLTTATYALTAPLGSAALTYACIYEPNIGLVPLPRPVPCLTYTSTTTNAMVQLGNQIAISGLGTVDSLVSHYLDYGDTTYRLSRADVPVPITTPPALTTLYSNTIPTGIYAKWTMMDEGLFQDPATNGYRRVAITTDPTTYSWITVSDWHTPATGSPAGYAIGANPSPSVATPRIFYHANRVAVLHAPQAPTDSAGFAGSAADLIDTSNLLPL